MLVALAEDLASVPSTHLAAHNYNSNPGGLVPSSGFCKYYIHVVHTGSHSKVSHHDKESECLQASHLLPARNQVCLNGEGGLALSASQQARTYHSII